MKKKTRIHISSLGQLRTTHTRPCPDKMMCQICMFEDREAWSYNIKIKVNCKLNRNKVERLFVWKSLKDAHMAANSLSCWPQTLNVVTLQLRKRLKQHLHTYTTPTWLKYGGKYGQNGTNHDCFGTELEPGRSGDAWVTSHPESFRRRGSRGRPPFTQVTNVTIIRLMNPIIL